MSVFENVLHSANRDKAWLNRCTRLVENTRRNELQELAKQADFELDGRKGRKIKALRQAGFKG